MASGKGNPSCLPPGDEFVWIPRHRRQLGVERIPSLVRDGGPPLGSHVKVFKFYFGACCGDAAFADGVGVAAGSENQYM